MESKRARLGLTRKPIAFSVSSTSHWLRAGPAGSIVYMKVWRLRLAVTCGSSWRTVPAPALRGFMNGCFPAASISRFSFSKLASGK